MRLKYFGTSYEKGLSLTVDLFDREGSPIHTGFPMTETGNDSAIYRTVDIFDTISSLPIGIYVTRVVDFEGNFLGYGELIFDGKKEITMLDIQFMTEHEKMQLRDALGIDGNKMIARNGQLQKKSEAPYNNTIDSTNINQ